MTRRSCRDPYARRWPIADLVEATGTPVQLLAAAAGFTKRSGHRWAVQGWVDDVIADRLACAAGWPAALVWSAWTTGAVDDIEKRERASRRSAGSGSLSELVEAS